MVQLGTGDERRCRGSGKRQSLRHPDSKSISKRLFPIDGITQPAVKLDISRKFLVRVEAELAETERGRKPLGMRHHVTTMPLTLEARRHRHVYDVEVVGIGLHLDERRELAA